MLTCFLRPYITVAVAADRDLVTAIATETEAVIAVRGIASVLVTIAIAVAVDRDLATVTVIGAKHARPETDTETDSKMASTAGTGAISRRLAVAVSERFWSFH